MLQTDHKKELNFDIRNLLGVIAFFPQGVYGKGVDGLFPTIAGRKHIRQVMSIVYCSTYNSMRDYLTTRHESCEREREDRELEIGL